MIQQPAITPPSAIKTLAQKRHSADWTFGQVDKRVKLKYGGRVVDPDDPQYELIKKLVLERYKR